MKRLLSLLMAAVLVLSMVPALGVYAAEPVTVYIDPVNGSNDNSGTEESPVQNFTTAYKFLQNGGGTVVMLSSVYYAGAYTFPACDYPVTITGKTGAEGIRTGSNIIVSGDTTFQNLTLTHLKNSTATMISGNGHKLTLGEGMTIVPFVNDTDSYYFCVQGGHPSNAVENTDVTIRSGQYRNVYVGGYTKNVTGNAKLTMTGGTAAVVAAGYSGSVSGNVAMSIGGTATISTLFAGGWTTGNVGGNVDITLLEGANITNTFSAGNGAGSITGTTTFFVDGYSYSGTLFKGKGNTSHTGTLGGSRLVLKSGTLSKTPTDFGTVDIEIPEGKTLTLATSLTANTLKADGTLNFSGAAALSTAAVTGSVNCTIEGEVLKNQAYITAPAGSAITFPADSGIAEQDGVWVNHDLEKFVGLILASDSANKVNLYGGIWAQGTSTTYTVVEPYHTETVDGVTYRYYPNAQGDYHVRATRSGYIALYKNIYMSAEEAAARTVEEIVLEKKGSDGFVPSTVYSHTTEVLESAEAWESDASLFPKYADALENPAFREGRDAHQMTTQEELEASIAAVDGDNDDMYVFSLGKSGLYGYDIPAVIFTQNDLSSATTLEEAAELMDDDRLTVYYRAQMHGNEPGGGEGALSMIHYLQQGYGAEILDKLNVIIVPRINPDGSYLYQRLLPSTVNPNRDQLRLESAEMQAIQRGYLLFDPEIVLDGHERVWNNQAGDIEVSASFTPMNSEAFRTTALEMDEAAFAELEANGLCGYYYSSAVNDLDPNMGAAYYAAAGSIYVLMESRGIYGGNEAIERRAVAHMAAVTGMLDYLYENDTEVKNVIAAERAAIAQKGATYEADDLFVLDTNSRTTTAADKEAWGYLYTDKQTVNWATGEVTFPTQYPTVSDVVVRTRTAPTAYVIPAKVEGIESILSLMDQHGISYTYLPEGATLPLQRYGGTTTEATLGAETATRFASGCYVFTMNQGRGLLLATLMEPDHTNAVEFYGAIAQMGLLNVSDTYRYVRDLNAQGTVDYTITEADLVNITVYLNGTNGADTNNGLTESTAVKTVERAYAIMDAALANAEPGSSGTLIVVGLYDLGAKQSHLPAASYPVVITGKTASDGFSFTGGSTQDTRTFEIHGPTTFRNVTLHINNTQSFNFMLANGHKVVIGEGVNCTTNKANCYFTLAGGAYGYTDSTVSADLTVRSGSWRTVYVGGYRASVTGLAKADISGCWIYQNIAPTYCGNIGSVDIKVANTTVSSLVDTSAIYAGPIAYSSGYKIGAIQGDATLTLGKNVTAQAVYCSSRDSGNVDGTVTVIADGVDLSQVPVYAKYSATPGSTKAAVLKLGSDIAQDVTLDAALPVDLNGHNITGKLTVDGTLTVKDSQTDDFTVADGVYGKLIGTVTGTVQAAEGYVAVDGQSFHRFEQNISGVSIRPGIAGIYYSAIWQMDEVLQSKVSYFGVAVSLVDMPDASFMGAESDALWTQFAPTELENGKPMTSVMIANIFSASASDNDERGKAKIYAAPYVVLDDGTLLVSQTEVAYSMYDVMKKADEEVYEANKQALEAFYALWQDPMKDWEFTNIGK